MKFTTLREYNDRLRATTGVHEREEIIRKLLNECRDTSERIKAAMLLIGSLSTPQEGLTTGIKEAFIAKDLGMEGRQSLESIGALAMERGEASSMSRDLEDVWAVFRSYLESPGRRHSDKSRIINVVMFDLVEDKEDIPFALQILCEKVNNGIDDKLILYAMDGRHHTMDPNRRETVSRAYSMNPDLARWIWAYDNLLEAEARSLLEGYPSPGVAIEPQLCARVDDLAKVLLEHEGMTVVQPKLDGKRVQIHVWKDGSTRQVRIFGRSLMDFTSDYPEIVAACATLPIRSQAILDGELVALGPDGEVAPFEVLQKRLGRKTGREAIQVGVVFYDLLLLDRQPIGATPYNARLVILEGLVDDASRLRVVESKHVASLDVLQTMLMEAYERGEEGLVCKNPNSLPEPGARNKNWIKLKPDYMEEGDFGDTYDLVVIGYQKGRGRRHGKIGALWVAIRDADRPPNLWPVCKVGTGLTYTDLEDFRERLKPVSNVPVEVWGCTQADKAPEIDVFVEPTTVVEIGATGGMTKIDKWAGFSLRFPYFVRVRDDKTPEQATSTNEVEAP